MEVEDKGHRHGNFPNYYSFHPPQNRLLLLEQCGLMTYIRRGLVVIAADDVSELGDDGTESTSPRKKARLDNAAGAAAVEARSGSIAEKDDIIYYCDLGCNEGDLTMAMAKSISEALRNNEQIVRCLGLDIDATLIQRARDKFSRKKVDDNSEKKEFMPVFEDCNLCSNDEHNNACSSFFANATETQQDIIPRQIFSLTTIFSTTMWVHIHAGDEGLTKFLERACEWTKKYLLIEPQHSGCYRKANIRLRKMKRPELDVSSERLKMRSDIENEIDKVVTGCGFRRVKLDDEGGEQGDDLRTAWNRTLQLYERNEIDED
mmetsp:Transcript_23252/g.38314  ORF Transcript_23252/g.38314 Transcript_23252/m.38314 type:complete len:318 (+) Transcript_23252:77-1030(+)